MSDRPLLSGLRVVEIGQYIAAPFAATLFADQGADVVKIERPGGDPYRADPARFAAWNRAKTSIELDLASASGRDEACRLIGGADVLVENLRPGSLARLGLDLSELRREHTGLVTCSISGYGSTGPARDEPGWEPLVHARAGAQQGLFTGDEPMWLPFPMASVAAGLLAALGAGAALFKRQSTGYGQHVETSLFEALLFLNAGAIFHPARRRAVSTARATRIPVLHAYETSDGRSMQVNLSGTERWRELCRLVGLDGEDQLDFSDPASLARLADREWASQMFEALQTLFASRTADEWEQELLARPAAVAKCNTLDEWIDHEQAAANDVFAPVDDPKLGPLRLVAPPVRVHTDAPEGARARRHGNEGGALGGVRVIDLSSFWAGPLSARLLAELGADVVKVEPPGGEGAYQLVPMLPNIYVDANRSKRGVTLELREPEDRERLLALVAASDVVVENAVAGTWERLGLGEGDLRALNPSMLYARAKGFGLHGPLASRPSFDYVVQAATGMIMTQGGGTAVPMNFTANDYCTGIHLAVGMVFALLARARGVPVSSVETSLMTSATVFQSEHVALLAAYGALPDAVGDDLKGPAPAQRLYQASDGWVAVCAVTASHEDGLRAALGVDDLSAGALARAIASLRVADACEALRRHGVPAAASVHPGHIPGDEQVRSRCLLASVRHPVAGRVVQVGIPLQLSVDRPAIKNPAPVPAPRRPARAQV